MNIETIRYFEEVARAESFYGAAKRLAVSQQGLNKAITSLERELSTKLLERSRKGVTLTPTGKSFLAFAQKVTADYGEFLDALYNPDEEHKREEDPFNIHVTHYSAQIASATQAYVDLLAQCCVYRGAFRENRRRAHASRTAPTSGLSTFTPTARSSSSRARSLHSTPSFARNWESCAMRRHRTPEESPFVDARWRAHPARQTLHEKRRSRIEWLFRDYPLQNVRMSVASPRMLIRFVYSRDDAVAFFDSFSYRGLALKDAAMPTDSLAFVPYSTPESMSYVGFLYPKHIRQKLTRATRREICFGLRHLKEESSRLPGAVPWCRRKRHPPTRPFPD